MICDHRFKTGAQQGFCQCGGPMSDHHAARLTRRHGWGVECPCGWRCDPRGPSGGRSTILKSEAMAIGEQHLSEAIKES